MGGRLIARMDVAKLSHLKSDIYQDENGEVVVKRNGAEEAIAAWNKRV